MQLDVIFTFDEIQKETNHSQIRITYPFHPLLVNEKKVFFEFVTSMLTGEQKEHLVKISTCVYFALGLPEPEWFKESNGKFYRDEIVSLMSDVWAIKSLTEPIN